MICFAQFKHLDVDDSGNAYINVCDHSIRRLLRNSSHRLTNIDLQSFYGLRIAGIGPVF